MVYAAGFWDKTMKWLSINKFTPPTGTEVILRIERKSAYDFIYERYITASAEYLCHDFENIDCWELSNGAIYDIDLDEYKVTHFAIIDAVEKS